MRYKGTNNTNSRQRLEGTQTQNSYRTEKRGGHQQKTIQGTVQE